jgi:hypothetical protein
MRNGISNKRRSSSAPPAAETFVEYIKEIPPPHCPLDRRPLYVHKCLRDLRWGFFRSGSYGEDSDIRSICMAGCSGRPDHSTHIANSFLPPERSLVTPRESWLVENFPWKYADEADLDFK